MSNSSPDALPSTGRSKRGWHEHLAPTTPAAHLRRVPRHFGVQQVTPEQREALERVALETFTSMANAGHTFQTAMAAVYFTGFTHALEASDEMRRSS